MNEIRINKKKKSESPKKNYWKWILVLAIFIGELFVYTWFRLDYTDTTYRITRKKSEQKELQAYRSELLIESERLASPERISQIAGTNLKLKMPLSEQVIYLNQIQTINTQ